MPLTKLAGTWLAQLFMSWQKALTGIAVAAVPTLVNLMKDEDDPIWQENAIDFLLCLTLTHCGLQHYVSLAARKAV